MNSPLNFVFKAILVVTLGTMVGYYFPDLTTSSFIVALCAVMATKYLTNFNWVGTVFLFIILAGYQNTGGSVPTYVLGRCVMGAFLSQILVYTDQYVSKK